MRGVARRRSTSEGEEDRLSSTLNFPKAIPISRLNEFNTERCASTPQINITGFIDDKFENNRGTQLESRIRTRSKEGSNSINIKLKDTLTCLENEIFKWGDFAYYTALSLDTIESRHNIFHAEIEQTISEVLLKRGDFSLLGELGSLQDRLGIMRR